MKIKRTLYILQFSFFIAIVFGIISCDIKPQPETPIFDGTKKIDLITPSDRIDYNDNERFIWEEPGDVDNLVMALFNSPPAVSDGLITNTQDWVAGASSDMSQFYSGYIYIQDLVLFDYTIGDYGSFTGTQFTTAHFDDGERMWWAVWAFSYGILTHSSPVYEINVDY